MEQELKNEIASTQDGRDITRGYVDTLPLLPTQDSLLLIKSGGDLLPYQEVLRDDQVKTCIGQRISAVTSCPWEVRPGGEKRIDKQAALFIEEQIKAILFDAITEKMLYGVFYGYAVAEAMFKVDGSRIVLDAERGGIKVRNRRRFGFGPDMRLKLKTTKSPMGEDLPDRKFWTFATGADNDDEPYGLGLAHWLYWPVFFKRNGVKFWLTFLEKFGTPTAVGKYQGGTPETEQNKLLDALKSIQSDSAIIFPQGMEAELLEATRGGTADYTALYDRMDAAIARVTLGQTASTQGTPGRLGNEKLQADVRKDIVKADADLICMSFNATIVRWLVEWNFPGAALPQMWRIIEEPEDLNAQADRDGKIASMGFKPTLKYIKDTYGGEWVESRIGTRPNNSAQDIQVGGNLPPAEFAEGDSQNPTAQEEDLLVSSTAKDWDYMVRSIRMLVDQAPDLKSLQRALVNAYGDMDSAELQRIMAAAFALAELKGMADVQDETGNA